MRKRIIFLTYSILFIFSTFLSASCSDPEDDTLLKKTKEETTKIEENILKNTLRMGLLKYLITDALKVTNDYQYIPKTIDDIYKINKDFRDFSEFFLNVKEDANAFNLIKKHLKVILGLIKKDKLPENIIIMDSKIEKYEIKNNVFKILITANVKIDYYLYESNTWNKKNGLINIEATGKVDALPKNEINPLGIKINNFKTTFLEKRGEKI